MMVLVMERVPEGLRGSLSRWLIEVRAGVFVGRPSAMVRDRLWEMACQQAKGGSVVMIQHADTEQGFRISSFGDPSRKVVNRDGLYLVQAKQSHRKR